MLTKYQRLFHLSSISYPDPITSYRIKIWAKTRDNGAGVIKTQVVKCTTLEGGRVLVTDNNDDNSAYGCTGVYSTVGAGGASRYMIVMHGRFPGGLLYNVGPGPG